MRDGDRAPWWKKLGRASATSVVAVVVLSALGCPIEEEEDDDDSVDPAGPAIDLDVDTDLDGAVDGSETEDVDEDLVPGAIARVNVDDDNLDGETDRDSVGHEGDTEDDHTLALLQPGAFDELADGDEIFLAIEGATEAFRFYIDGEPVMGLGSEFVVVEHALGDAGTLPLEIEVEGIEFYSSIMIRAQVRDDDGGLVIQDKVVLTTAPLMFAHHFDAPEKVWMADTGASGAHMLRVLENALGEENVERVSVMQYGQDRWLQDEMQIAYQQTPYGPMQVLINTIRDRGLDPFVDSLLGDDLGQIVGGSGNANGLDYGGNIECSPPLTVDGTEYPFGRIYYGGEPGDLQVNAELREFLDAQEVQSPVEIDTTWLAVGHIDEYMAFIPDADSPKGFRVLWTDHQLAADILASVDPNMSIPRFTDHGFETVGEILDSSVMDFSDDADVTEMQPELEHVKEIFGLTEEDILRLPGIWENAGGGYAVAMVPGIVNLMVYGNHLFFPDPFMRTPDEDWDGDGEYSWDEDLNGNQLLDTDEDFNGNGVLDDNEDLDCNGQLDDGEDTNGNGTLDYGEDLNHNCVLDSEEDADGDWMLDPGEDLNGNGRLDTFRDPFVEYMEQNLPASVEFHWVDTWNASHLLLGEIHCISEVRRTPPSDLYWWEVL